MAKSLGPLIAPKSALAKFSSEIFSDVKTVYQTAPILKGVATFADVVKLQAELARESLTPFTDPYLGLGQG